MPPSTRDVDRRHPGADVPASVTLGLFAAWAVHDLEEVAVLPGWLGTELPRLREQFSQVPDPV